MLFSPQHLYFYCVQAATLRGRWSVLTVRSRAVDPDLARIRMDPHSFSVATELLIPLE